MHIWALQAISSNDRVQCKKRWRSVAAVYVGATIDCSPCTATLREARADRNQYDVHHRMHPPPVPHRLRLAQGNAFPETRRPPLALLTYHRHPCVPRSRIIRVPCVYVCNKHVVRFRMHRSIRPRWVTWRTRAFRCASRGRLSRVAPPAGPRINSVGRARRGGGAVQRCTPTARPPTAAGRRTPDGREHRTPADAAPDTVSGGRCVRRNVMIVYGDTWNALRWHFHS